jgi:hypothetical protein
MGQVSCGEFHPLTPVVDFALKGLEAGTEFEMAGDPDQG